MSASLRRSGRSQTSRTLAVAVLVFGTSAFLGQLLGIAPIQDVAVQHGSAKGRPGALVGQASATTPGTTNASPAASHSNNAGSRPSPKAKPTGPPKTLSSSTAGSSTPIQGAPAPLPLAAPSNAVYMHYYLWWTSRHWSEKLGGSYPYSARPLPAPGYFDATGCNPKVRYGGATIVDVPQAGLYDQGSAATFDLHIAQAVAAGITGFIVSWQGTGTAQTPGSSGYNARLDVLVSRVNTYNAVHGTGFRLVLGMEAFGNYGRPASQVIADLNYFRGRYAANPAFLNRWSRLPMVMWLASRFAPLSTIQAVSAAERGRLFLLGDETSTSWGRDGRYLDGSAYYWSSQDPVRNPQSGAQVAALAAQVHAVGKPWFAPFNGGFNTQLNGGSTCVPRRGIATLDGVWNLNRPSRPQAWFGISWNEYVENSYLEPSVLYGRTFLNEIARLIRS